MITREQVRDLRAGDVVELAADDWQGAVIRGPLVEWDDGVLILGVLGHSAWMNGRRFIVRTEHGDPSPKGRTRHLTVISRVPRIYVNSPRTEPHAGDVVRDGTQRLWMWLPDPLGLDAESWISHDDVERLVWSSTADLAEPVRLLVDGNTSRWAVA